MTTKKRTVTKPTTKFTCAYEQNLSKSSDVKNKEAILEDVEQARIQIQADILEATKLVRRCSTAVEKAKCSTPLNTYEILSAMADLKDAEDSLSALLSIKEELFG
jgi:hypothetical protein